MTNNARKTIPVIIIIIALAALAVAVIYGQRASGPVANPSPEPAPSTPTEGAPSTHWSDPITPACGENLTEGDLNSGIRFLDPPDEISPEESFPVTVSNSTSEPAREAVDRYDVAVPVLTDKTGTVVAMAPLEPVLAEGFSILALAPSDSLGMSGTLRWAVPCGDDPEAIDPAPIPDGDYDLFLLASTVPREDESIINQIQGGPFPISVRSDASHPVPDPKIVGGPALPSCGQEWPNWHDAPLPGRITLASEPQIVDGDLALSGGLELQDDVAGASLYGQIVIIRDGVMIGPQPHASDNLIGWYASAGLGDEISVVSAAETCDGTPLASGTYEAALVVSTIDSESSTVAATEPVTFTIP